MPQSFERFIQSPYAMGALIVVGVLVMVPGINSGFFADDFYIGMMLTEPVHLKQPDNLSPFNLFTFYTTDPERRLQVEALGMVPWWTASDASLIFFRPLAEISHYVDFNGLYDPVLMHIHSLVWYTLLLILLARFYSIMMPNRLLALLAMAFFISETTHNLTVNWLANRSALMAVTFSILSVNALHAGIERRSAGMHSCAFLSCILALSSAEVGVTSVVLVAGYLTFLDKRGKKSRVVAFVPYAIILLMWQWIYHAYGYGVHGSSDYYINPLADPVRFLTYLPERFTVAIAALFNPVPVFSYVQHTGAGHIVGTVLVLLTVLLVWGVKQPAYRFLALGMLILIIPVCVAVIQERNLLAASTVSSGVFAFWVFFIYQCLKKIEYSNPRSLAVFCLAGLVSASIILSLAIQVPYSRLIPKLAAGEIATAKAVKRSSGNQSVIIMGLPHNVVRFVVPINSLLDQKPPVSMWHVTTTPGTQVQWQAGDVINVANPKGVIDRKDLDYAGGSLAGYQDGSEIPTQVFQLTIKAVTDQGLPTSMDLRMEDQPVEILMWKGHEFKLLSSP